MSGEQRRAPRGTLRLHKVKRNVQQRMDGTVLLADLEDDSAALAFLDPQYRAVLDKMAYGNEDARQKRRATMQAMTDSTISIFVREIERVLKPSGHLILWMDKFTLLEGHFVIWLSQAPTLTRVDLMNWNNLRFGMGKRTRKVTEYAAIFQKPPIRAKGIWTDHSIRDSWPEMSDRDIHPHAKPRVLTERLIRAVTRKGDLVVDPCAGGYGVLDACIASGREFVGCDLMEAPDAAKA